MTTNIWTAISEIQADPPALLKDGRGQYGSYLTLGNLLDALLPELARRGVALSQSPTVVEGQPALKTALVHAESDTAVTDTMLLMSSQANPQQQGSAITYARRYALTAILGLSPDEDDDGQSATNAVRGTTPARQNRPTPPAAQDASLDMVTPF